LVLNTYAKYLTYFTLKPREKKVKTDVLAIEFPKSVTILAGRVWVGYDEGSKFEAGLSIWLQPKLGALRRLWNRIFPEEMPTTRPSEKSVILTEDNGNFYALRPPSYDPNQFSGNVYIGGVYLHRHTAATAQQDYYPLNELHALKPIRVNTGSRVIVNRDIFNIDLFKTFNAWDCELILVADE
jgi:hypothetical protein